MKKLPKIYKNEEIKPKNNNKLIYRFKNSEENIQTLQENLPKTLMETLDEIFSGIGYSYNTLVLIKTPSKTYETTLIAKTKSHLITIDNELIPLQDIISLQIKKPL